MSRVTLHFPHTGVLEDRGDYWAAISEDFGIVVYGPSEEKAEAKLVTAITLLLDTLAAKGEAHVFARFKHGSIPYLLLQDDDDAENGHNEIIRFRRDMKRELEFAT